MGREFELKYQAAPETIAAIHGKFGEFTRISMETTYYDTADLALRSRKWTLRQRLENGLAVCTVKTPLPDGSRGEWETENADLAAGAEALCAMGIQYSRTVESTGSFALPQELLRWKPTCHHNDKLLERAEKFLHVPGYEKMPLFYIWGHSFEFERENTWPLMEQLAEKLHGAQDIWYATNAQIADYLTALRSTRESADGKRLYNPSAQPIWFVADGKVRVAEPGKLCEI